MKQNTLIEKKAMLLSIGKISVPKGLKLPAPSRSTAGPSVGKDAIHIELREGRKKVRLRLVISKGAPFSLQKKGGRISLMKNSRLYHPDIKVLPKIVHSPTHAFINIDPRCSYNCAFCNSPSLDFEPKNIDDVLRLLTRAEKMGADSVALTSGVIINPEFTNNMIADIISKIKIIFPELTVGVELYVDSNKAIQKLKKAGAAEIKLNIQSSDKRIFKKICPSLDYKTILELLPVAVKTFGRGKVCSNIIIGLGETDSNVLRTVERLAKMGVIATIRPIAIDDKNLMRLRNALGRTPVRPTPERLIALAQNQKKILSEHGLTTRSFATMCHNCACCEIEPFIDF